MSWRREAHDSALCIDRAALEEVRPNMSTLLAVKSLFGIIASYLQAAQALIENRIFVEVSPSPTPGEKARERAFARPRNTKYEDRPALFGRLQIIQCPGGIPQLMELARPVIANLLRFNLAGRKYELVRLC